MEPMNVGGDWLTAALIAAVPLALIVPLLGDIVARLSRAGLPSPRAAKRAADRRQSFRPSRPAWTGTDLAAAATLLD